MSFFRRWKQHWNPFALDLFCCSSSCSPKLLACLAESYQIMTYSPRRHDVPTFPKHPSQIGGHSTSFTISQTFWHQGFLWTANEITLDPVSVGLGLAQDAMLVPSQYWFTWIEEALNVLKWIEMACGGHTRRTKHHDKHAETRKWRANKSGSQTDAFTSRMRLEKDAR